MKKILLTLAASLLVAFGSFADEYSFSNEISSGIVNVLIDGSTTDVEFAGIENRTKAEFITDKFDVGIDASIFLASSPLGLTDFELNDWYMEVRPVKRITIGFHDVIETAGSKFLATEEYFANGNLGSDLVLVLRPIDGLRICGGLDVLSVFEDNSTYGNPDMNFGIDYTYGKLFAVGATVRDVANNLGAGMFVSVNPAKNLTVNLAYSYNDLVYFHSMPTDVQNNIMGSVKYIYNDFTVANDQYVGIESGNVIYLTNLLLGYDFTDIISGELAFNFGVANSNILFAVNPSMSFTKENHEFSLGLDYIYYPSGDMKLSFPISYKYSF